MKRDYTLSATLLGTALADLARLAQEMGSEELTAVVQQLHQAADVHWGDDPRLSTRLWMVATARLQQLLEDEPQLRQRVMALGAPIEEPVEVRPRQKAIRTWSTKPRRHLPRLDLHWDGGRAYEA